MLSESAGPGKSLEARRSDDPSLAAEGRYAARMWLWDHSTLARVRKCGRVRYGGPVQARRLPSGSASFHGLVSCGSVWSCPPDNARISAVRGLELGAGVAGWLAGGGSVYLMTFTLRHRMGQPLADLLGAVQECWRAVGKSDDWRARDALGVYGWARFLEVTYGANGWHPHLHVPVFTSGHVTQSDAQSLGSRLFLAWRSRAVALGLAAPLPQGHDVTPVLSAAGIAEYLTDRKSYRPADRFALEVTHSQGKTGRGKFAETAPAWSLLEAATRGDGRAARLWQEYERATYGKRSVTWARGFRQVLDLGAEFTDEQIAAQEEGTWEDTLFTIPGRSWDSLVRERRHLLPPLRAAIRQGLGPALAFVKAHEIEHYTPRELGIGILEGDEK
jgi:hypothetical protein